MKLRIGVIDCGVITVESHIPSFKNIDNADFVAICDVNLPLSKEKAAKFNIMQVYDDVDEMLRKEKLDVVDICTPPRTHSFNEILLPREISSYLKRSNDS